MGDSRYTQRIHEVIEKGARPGVSPKCRTMRTREKEPPLRGTTERDGIMKVIASAIAATLTTAIAAVSLAAMVAIAPATDAAESVFDAPTAEITAEAETVVTEITVPTAAEAEAETAVTETAAAEATPELPVADTGNGEMDDAPIMTPGTINVSGNVMGYIDYFEQPTAPQRGAGLWLGSDSTTDGTWGYFIGHNPGDFAPVMDLQGGDAVTVCDRDGNFRTYYVVDAFTVTTETYWSDIEARVTGYGESITLQCCVGDGAHYRVVVCL